MEEPKSVFVPDYRGDLYSREAMYFCDFTFAEKWDFKNVKKFSFSQFSFLLLRSFYHQEKFGKPLEIENLHPGLKKDIALSGISGFPSLAFSPFVPYMLEAKKNTTKFSPVSVFSKSAKGFKARQLTANKICISGAVSNYSKSNENLLLSRFYTKNKKNNGIFFLRTKEHVLIRINETGYENNNIFTQNKTAPFDNFIFYYMEIEKMTNQENGARV